MSHFNFHYINNKDGATAIEYGLIGAGIALAIAAAVFLLGDQLVPVYNAVLAVLVNAAARV